MIQLTHDISHETLIIVGVGLIGGSVALSFKKNRSGRKVIGADTDVEQLKHAARNGIIDDFADITDPIPEAKLIILAAPVSQNRENLAKLGWAVRRGLIITDTGSTKKDFIALAKKLYPSSYHRIVPAHPIAGGEKAGVGAAKSNLFHGKKVVITPLSCGETAAVRAVEKMWSEFGSEIVKMSAEDHDKIFSTVSHLPHLLSYALVNMVSRKQVRHNLFDYSGGGFRDFTRIAASSPEMWGDICEANREFIMEDLKLYRNEIDELLKNIRTGNKTELLSFFKRAKALRLKHLQKKRDD